MATLGTQTISTSYTQLLKTFGSNIVDGTMRAISSGDEAGISALQISTTGAKSTGTFAVDGASTLLGPVTFGSNTTLSTGTTTIATASISTATISTATIPLQLGPVTFGTNVTMSTGTATIGTIASTTINNTGLATVGTLEIGATGPSITKVSYGTFPFTGGTVQTHAANDTTTGTFALPCQLGDIVFASINSLGSTNGTALVSTDFFPIATDVVRFNIIGKGQTAGTIPAGTIFATAMRFTT
jgi:hypothetical protein